LIVVLIPHLEEGDLAILQYANNTILLLDDDLDNARGFKFFVVCVKETKDVS
jgi:hypothetical protein